LQFPVCVKTEKPRQRRTRGSPFLPNKYRRPAGSAYARRRIANLIRSLGNSLPSVAASERRVGKFATIRSLASLAFDCRRTDMFQAELMDALRIVERGDLTPAEMHGAWAGEIGQTQFMPSSYIKYAIDYDGNGRRDLIRSPVDVLASTANYLRSYGWQRGQPWGPGSPNFDVLVQWNKSQIYSRTVAYFAQRLDQMVQ
jgi:membrane-bound lytic murein transglycosylase B